MGKQQKQTKVAKSGKKNAANVASQNTKKKTPPPMEVKKTQGLSPPQLSILVCLCVGATYLLEMRSTVRNGAESSSCSTYFADGSKSCSESDLFFILVKYHSSLLLGGLLTGLALLCWEDAPLLQFLNMFLVASPLGTTCLGILVDDNVIAQDQRIKFFLMSIFLTFLILTGLRMDKLAPIRSFKKSPVSIYLILLILSHSWHVFDLFKNTAVGFTTIDSLDVTEGSQMVFRFMIIDLVSITCLMMFALLCLDDIKKRAFLLYLATANVCRYYLQIPLEEANLAQLEYIRAITVGTAISSFLMIFLPDFKAKSKTS